MQTTRHINGKIELRPHEDGSFDELVMYDKPGKGKACLAHAEMMDNGTLWIAFYPPGEKTDRVCLWITASKRGNLKIKADDESI